MIPISELKVIPTILPPIKFKTIELRRRGEKKTKLAFNFVEIAVLNKMCCEICQLETTNKFTIAQQNRDTHWKMFEFDVLYFDSLE